MVSLLLGSGVRLRCRYLHPWRQDPGGRRVPLHSLLIHRLRPGLRRHARHRLTPRWLALQLVGGRAGGVRAGGERVGARRAAEGAGEARARGARAGRRGSAGRGRLCVGDEARRAGGGAAAASGAGGWGSCETYGGCLQRGSFRHIAAVALMLDVLEPIDIYKKQLQTRDQTHAQDMAQYHACRAPLNCTMFLTKYLKIFYSQCLEKYMKNKLCLNSRGTKLRNIMNIFTCGRNKYGFRILNFFSKVL